MRARPNPLEALVTLPRLKDPGERRASWRQAIAALGQSTRLIGPPPLDGIDTERLVQAVQVAVETGLADDLEWIAPGSAAVALYEMTAALPVGKPRRELGRRVFARLYEGTAATFAAVATRMALASGRSLETPTMRARVSLLFDLPIGSTVNADPLALTLVTRRELHDRWVERPSIGALSARSLAAKLLEHAAREAVFRYQQGDPHARDALIGELVRPSFRRLLADREPLVWRHAAVARGLLSTIDPGLRDEIELALDPGLTPTEWRRAAVSLIAALAANPVDGVLECVRVLEGELAVRDPGIAGAMVMGLPRVIEGEPDIAEELLDQLCKTRRPDVAEALAGLLADVTNPNFGVRTARTLQQILEDRDAERPSLLPGLAVRALDAVDNDRTARETVHERVRQALVAYEATGARAAYELAVAAVGQAKELMDFVSGRAPFAMNDEVAGVLTALNDLDASTLERSRLWDLLLLSRRPGEGDASVPEMERLLNILGGWLLDSQQQAMDLEWSRPVGLANQRYLRVLLHLVDLDTTHSESDNFGVRERVRLTVRVLLRRLVSGPDASVHRILCATLARSFDAAVREAVFEPSDMLLCVAQLLSDPHSIETIAEASTNPDVSGAFRAYARFVNPDPDETAPQPDEFENIGVDEETRRIAQRLVQLSHHLGSSGSYRGEALRRTVFRLARALELSASVRGLSELVNASEVDHDPVSEIEGAADALRQMIASACRRVAGEEAEPITIVADVAPISALIERAVGAGVPANEQQTAMAVTELTADLPGPIAEAMGAILSRLGALPISVASDVYAIPLEKRRAALPDWLLPRRTMGAFYVVRALGSGGVSSVFVARRFEERHNANAEAFALKVPQYDPTTARSLSEQEFLQMFRDEAGALLSLPQHPNLARFVTFDLAARPKPILVMELIEGIGLDRLIRGRSLATDRGFEYLDGILAALEGMHGAGVGHLDVKPSNVILRGNQTPVLVDFGLTGRHLRPGCGTLEYCAPEILGVVPKNVTPAPGAADMYAFACLAFEVLTATMLFDAEDEMSLMALQISHDGWPERLTELASHPDLAELAVILAACLRRDPRQRPTAAETRAALRAINRRLSVMPWPLQPQRRTSMSA